MQDLLYTIFAISAKQASLQALHDFTFTPKAARIGFFQVLGECHSFRRSCTLESVLISTSAPSIGVVLTCKNVGSQ